MATAVRLDRSAKGSQRGKPVQALVGQIVGVPVSPVLRRHVAQVAPGRFRPFRVAGPVKRDAVPIQPRGLRIVTASVLRLRPSRLRGKGADVDTGGAGERFNDAGVSLNLVR